MNNYKTEISSSFPKRRQKPQKYLERMANVASRANQRKLLSLRSNKKNRGNKEDTFEDYMLWIIKLASLIF